MTARAFQIHTEEGSCFVARFDPAHTMGGTQFGRLQVVGDSKTQGRRLRLVGIAALPEPGGQITVSNQPTEWIPVENDPVPIYPKETITRVVEIALPGV